MVPCSHPSTITLCSLCELGKAGISPTLLMGGVQLKTKVASPQVTEIVSDERGRPAF